MTYKEKYDALVKIIVERCIALHEDAMDAVSNDNFNVVHDKFKVLRELISDTHDKELIVAYHKANREKQREKQEAQPQ